MYPELGRSVSHIAQLNTSFIITLVAWGRLHVIEGSVLVV